MKTLRLFLAGAFLFSIALSCTPETQANEYQTDKDEVCPPNDRNCNGVPDDEE